MNKSGGSRGPEIDLDKCVDNIGKNRFDMILVASARAREIKQQHFASDRREHVFSQVTALLEIQEGKVGREYLKKLR